MLSFSLIGHNIVNQASIAAWPGLEDLSLGNHCSPHIAAWEYSTRLCIKHHWESNSCFLPSDFFTNVHIRSISDIPLASFHCPSIEFYQQYHYICSAAIIGEFNDIRLQKLNYASDFFQGNLNSSVLSPIQDGCPNLEPLISSCPLFSLTQSGCGQLPLSAKNQRQNVNNNFIEGMRACISMINSALEMYYCCPIVPDY